MPFFVSCRSTFLTFLFQLGEETGFPLTVGGGIRSVEDVRRMLKAGADKVGMNTAAVHNPQLVNQSAIAFGNQCIVVAIDAKRVLHRNGTSVPGMNDLALDDASKWQVYTHGGRTPTGIDAVKWAVRVVELGAGEILLTSMDEAGRLSGYDLNLTRTISEAVPVPVIASGGAGGLDHLYEALEQGKADAVLAASIFHFGKFTIDQAKQYLKSKGVPIRPKT